MDSLESSRPWNLVDLPPGYKAIGYKWILRNKLKLDRLINKYKSFFDTFSPITRITSIRMLIYAAFLNNLLVHQMDVKIIFLNGDLK